MDRASRLMIERVVLENFKSYAGTKEIGPFHKCFTAVVGPNGSGKSNLLEALLFAFGKRANKMRLKKLSDLIHHSSEHPNLKYACVSVFFQNVIDTGEQTFDVVPGSGLQLKRKVKASGENSYYLNGSKSNFEAVTTVLKHRGIDLEHNRFLILQGEVEQIALMKPKGNVSEDGKTTTTGLLEYLEEIIGTNVYVDQLKATEEEIEKAGEDVTSSQLKVNQSTKDIQALEGSKNEAVERLKLEVDKYKINALLHQLMRRQNENELDTLQEILENARAGYSTAQQNWKQLKETHNETLAKFKEVEQDLKATSQAKEQDEKTFQGLMARDSTLTTQCSVLNTTLKEVTADKTREDTRYKKLLQEFSESELKVPQLQHKISEVASARARLAPRLDELEVQVVTTTETQRKQRQKLEQEILPYEAKLEETVSECRITEDKIRHMFQEREETAAQIAKLTSDIKATIDLIGTKELQINEVTPKIQETVRNIGQCQEALNQATTELNEVEQRLIFKQDEARRLERKNEKGESKNKLMVEIGKACTTGELRGILGRLGDLASIAPQFDIAISNSVSCLNHIVVESVSNAEALIDFARSRGLGKVNIASLEKMTQNFSTQAARPFRCPSAKVVRLLDQVQIEDKRLLPVFYYAMRDTLVARTVEDAREVAFGAERHRVVTLGGDILEASGAMQGFSNPRRGLMRTEAVKNMEDEAALSRVTTEINSLRQQQMSLKDHKSTLSHQHPRLVKERSDLEHSLRMMQDELASLRQKLSLYEKRRDQARRNSSALSDESIEELQKLIHAKETMKHKLSQSINVRREQIKQVQQSIDEAGGPEYIELKRQVQEVDSQRTKLETELNSSVSKVQQLDADIKKSTARLQDLEAKFITTQQQLEAYALEKLEIEDKATPVLERMTEASAREDMLKQQHSEMLAMSKGLEESFEKVKREADEWKQKIQENNSKTGHKKAEVDKLTNKLEAVRNEARVFLMEFESLFEPEAPQEGDEVVVEPMEKRFKSADFSVLRKNLNFEVGKNFTKIELDSFFSQFKDIRVLATRIEDECDKAGFSSNAITEYRRVRQDLEAREEELRSFKHIYELKRNLYSELKTERHDRFTADFKVISGKLREMYQMITRGGDAELEFADSTDPFSEGIVFTVRPPKKSWKKMANLSGGEKTLSSLALVFALHHYKPTALYVMDEVDAALDFQNVSIIANYIKSRTKNAQFIIVSLRYQMFELADRLIGVYKTQDVTRTVALSPCSLMESQSTNPIIQQTVRNLSGVIE
jgi:structural maintenance of chromosome 4